MALVDTATGVIVSDLTPDEARELTEAIKDHTNTLWALLTASADRRAWAALGYPSWREYATTEFKISQSRAYQLLDQARVIAAIEEAADSTMVEITEREARDLKPVLAEAAAAVKAATEDVPTEAEKQERARKALDDLRNTMVQRNRPEAGGRAAQAPADLGERSPSEPAGTRVPAGAAETIEQRDAREAEESRLRRNKYFGEHLIGMRMLLGNGEQPVRALLDGWVPEECPMWLVDAHKPLFTADGIRAVAALMEKLATEWESRV